jgi:hypothetical protein
MRWAENVKRVWEMTNALKILAGNPEWKTLLERYNA